MITRLLVVVTVLKRVAPLTLSLLAAFARCGRRIRRASQNRNFSCGRSLRECRRGDKQEIRVLTASFRPGDRTVFHTHRFPVTVYILEGAFTLEMAGRAPVTVKAGEAFVEPPNVKMTGYNRSTTDSFASSSST